MSGANTHPTPVDVKIRVRLLLMGASPVVAVGSRAQPSTSGPAVAMEEEQPTYLSADALNLGRIDIDEDTPEEAELESLMDGVRQTASDDPSSTVAQQSVTSTTSQRFARDALEYVAGFVAYKCRSIAPGLGKKSADSSAVMDSSWTQTLNRGGLTIPSTEWMELVVQFETEFCVMHGVNDVDRKPGVVQRLFSLLRHKHPHVDPRVLRKYAVTRSHMRIKWIQRRHAESQRDKRSAKRMARYARSVM